MAIQQINPTPECRIALVRQQSFALERVRENKGAEGGSPIPSLRALIREDARLDGAQVRVKINVTSE